jgi:GntR family transcriptional regulator, rspAB operon transcriptional repressor
MSFRPSPWRRPSTTSARSEVYARIRDAIVRLELPPGAKIQDVKLAESLGVSRTPVREALLQLASEGLVQMLPQHGTYVSRISVDAVREAQFVREALETAAVRFATDRITDEQIGELEANVGEQRSAEAGGDVERFYRLDDAFHRALIVAGGYPGAARIAEQSRAHLNRVRWLSLPTSELISGELIPQHAEILARIADHDAEGADAALREHLRLILRDLPEFAREHPDFFEADAPAPLRLPSSTIAASEEEA